MFMQFMLIHQLICPGEKFLKRAWPFRIVMGHSHADCQPVSFCCLFIMNSKIIVNVLSNSFFNRRAVRFRYENDKLISSHAGDTI